MNPVFEVGQSVAAYQGYFYDRGTVKQVLQFDERQQEWRYLIRFRAGYEADVAELFVRPIEPA